MAFGNNPNIAVSGVNPNALDFSSTTSSLTTAINSLREAMFEFVDDATPTANFVFQSVHENIFSVTDNMPLRNMGMFLIESIVEDIAEIKTTSIATLNCFGFFKSTKGDSMITQLPLITAKLRKVFNEPDLFPLLWPSGNALNTRFNDLIRLERSAGLPQRIFPTVSDREPYWTISMTLQIKLTGY